MTALQKRWLAFAALLLCAGMALLALLVLPGNSSPTEDGIAWGMVLEESEAGPYVLAVMEGSSADRLGIEPGDVITSLDGAERPTSDSVRNCTDPQPHRLTLNRKGTTVTVDVGTR